MFKSDQCRAFFLSVVLVAAHFLFLLRVSDAAPAVEEQLGPALMSPSQQTQSGWHWLIHCVHKQEASSFLVITFVWLLGPFYGTIAVPSVTRCRRHCCGHRCAGGVWQWRHATVATPGEWQCGAWWLAVANGPNIFQMLLVLISTIFCTWIMLTVANSVIKFNHHTQLSRSYSVIM